MDDPLFENKNIRLFIKRDDLIHPLISGNKWRKLKYNLWEAQKQNRDIILTFGGAYSNHIAATAAACRLAGMKSIGIIRGEELRESRNHTLRKAAENGMRLEFISREQYRRKHELEFIAALREKLEDFYLIPEGGSNELGMKGCMEIMQEVSGHFDFICVACGTGTTLAGLVLSAPPEQTILGFPALKNAAFIEQEIKKLIGSRGDFSSRKIRLITDYHFGGYAKHSPELLQFMNDFKSRNDIEMDFVYTGKMLFGIYNLMTKGFFPANSKILAIHTGGLQGNSDFTGG